MAARNGPLKPRSYDRQGRLQMAEGSLTAHEDHWTPPDNRFLVHHYDQPDVSGQEYLRLRGLGDQLVRLGLGDLRTLPTREVVAVLECAGNGRGLRARRAPGNQLGLGMFAQSHWSGAPLSAVIERAELGDDWSHLVVEAPDHGVTQPEGIEATEGFTSSLRSDPRLDIPEGPAAGEGPIPGHTTGVEHGR